MKRILFISSSRADYGLLRNVIFETKKNKKIKVFVFVSGSHLSKQFGNTIKEIERDGLKKNIIKKRILKKNFSENDISNYISQAITATSNVLDKIKPEKMVILGDRYELLGCAIASMSHRIPIVHIHGGEVTAGAIDDSIRHSISKLSHLHFPIHDTYKKRLIQLGESSKTIFNYGGLGAYSIKNIEFKSKSELENELKIKLDKEIFLITFHPTTLEKDKSKYQVSNLLSALDKFKNVIKIFTSSNFDHENKIIRKKILDFMRKNKNTFFYSSLGHLNYVSLMKNSTLVIGNSSSGVLETPSLGIPTVNIGNRQKGRIISDNIINSKYEKNHIIKNIKKALILDKKKLYKVGSPFYKADTPKKIAKKIISFKCDLKKDFKDLI
jgi:GDP/UDP-N,N'-diacetylbacillosamine 2-epimerase (hydrolysing)